jgi:hypothetical protein
MRTIITRPHFLPLLIHWRWKKRVPKITFPFLFSVSLSFLGRLCARPNHFRVKESLASILIWALWSEPNNLRHENEITHATLSLNMVKVKNHVDAQIYNIYILDLLCLSPFMVQVEFGCPRRGTYIGSHH